MTVDLEIKGSKQKFVMPGGLMFLTNRRPVYILEAATVRHFDQFSYVKMAVLRITTNPSSSSGYRSRRPVNPLRI